MTPGSPVSVDDEWLAAARWRLLDLSDREEHQQFLDALAAVEPDFRVAGCPRWIAWSHAFAARRLMLEDDSPSARDEVLAARVAGADRPADAEQALTLAYLAYLEVSADRHDSALHLAVDASLLTEEIPAVEPRRELGQAHRWLSVTLTRLDLEELAVAQALQGHRVAASLGHAADCWRLLRLCAQQHAELAQTVHRRGETTRAAQLAVVALRCSFAAKALDWEPPDAEADLLDVVHAWALTLSDDLDDTLPALRRIRRRVEATGGIWLRGYSDLVLARLLVRIATRPGPAGDPATVAATTEATDLLADAAGAFAAVGDHRRHRQCLLELGQATAHLGRAAEAVHWLEAYRVSASRVQLRGRELWAEMFARRSRLREAERQTVLMRRQALEDPLTGLGNRRGAELRFAEIDLATQPLALAVVDIDRFKTVNDGNSHLHGDAVLRRLAALLVQHCRAGDDVFRWAGDEFLVLLPGTTEAHALAAMERLREAVVHYPWEQLGIAGAVTVSIGIATTTPPGPGAPDRVCTWRELFDRADLHLFTAKQNGRDQVRTSSPIPRRASLPPAEGRGADAGAGDWSWPRTPPAHLSSIDDLVTELVGSRDDRPSGWAFAAAATATSTATATATATSIATATPTATATAASDDEAGR